MFKKILVTLFFCINLNLATAAESNFNYPELEVSPRASERVQLMLEKEKNMNFMSNLPMQISAISTLLSGVLQSNNYDSIKDPEKTSPTLGLFVGATWLGINYYFNTQAKFFEKTNLDMNRVSNKTNRDALIRERIAEEGIEYAAKNLNTIKWISVISQLSTHTYMISKSKKDSNTKPVQLMLALTSFLPLLYNSDWENVSNMQQNYKKRIYSPILTTSFFETKKNTFKPGFLLSINF